ncbi:MAG: hypothetical protein WEE20_10425 [Bacteroidota bacterium]
MPSTSPLYPGGEPVRRAEIAVSACRLLPVAGRGAPHNYYNVVNGFRDPLSIRTDQPGYSNINGGQGLFAAYAVDSVTYRLPDDFVFNKN